MNSWDRFIIIVWRFTIAPALFCLLLLCGIFSFFLGGPRFFSGCWKMAMYGMMVDWNSGISYGRDSSDFIGDYCKLERTNFISLLLWTLVFGIWIRILLMALMFVTHLLLFSDWLAEAMLDLADCVRNPAYVRDFYTRNLQMDDDGRLHKEEDKTFRPFEISRRSDFSKLDGGNWKELLSKRPQFADMCDWSELDGGNWAGLLYRQPQFADKCDWSKLDGGNWADLLYSQPQFADKCNWSKLDGGNWPGLLQHQPQFADKCDKWDEFSSEDWMYLLEEQPQFADKCDKWDEFSSEEWKYLLRHQPQFKARRRDE